MFVLLWVGLGRALQRFASATETRRESDRVAASLTQSKHSLRFTERFVSMGQAWYGAPATTAGNVALIHQAGDVNVDAIAAAADSGSSPVGQTQPVDPKFVQKLVEEAAAQVYEDVHLQLKNIQETSLHQTQQLVRVSAPLPSAVRYSVTNLSMLLTGEGAADEVAAAQPRLAEGQRGLRQQPIGAAALSAGARPAARGAALRRCGQRLPRVLSVRLVGPTRPSFSL